MSSRQWCWTFSTFAENILVEHAHSACEWSIGSSLVTVIIDWKHQPAGLLVIPRIDWCFPGKAGSFKAFLQLGIVQQRFFGFHHGGFWRWQGQTMKHRKHDNSWYEEIWTNQFRWLQSDHSKQVIDSHWSTKSAEILYQDYHDSRLKTWCFLFIALTSKFCSRIWKHVVSWFSQLSGLVVLDTYRHCFNITRSLDLEMMYYSKASTCLKYASRENTEPRCPWGKKHLRWVRTPLLSIPFPVFVSWQLNSIDRRMWKCALSIFEF